MTTPIPAYGYASNSSLRTVSDMETFIEELLSFIKEGPSGTGEQSSVQLSSHTFTPATNTTSSDPGSGDNACWYKMETQSAGSSDTLNNISTSNIRDGQLIGLRTTNNAHVITVANNAGGSGQIYTADGNNFVMNNTKVFLVLKYNLSLTAFEEVFRSTTPALAGTPVCMGRLYTVSGSPDSDGSSSGNSTLYFGPIPQLGNQIALSTTSGSLVLNNYSFSQASLSVSGLTSGVIHDVYVYWNSGTGNVAIDTPVAWTNNTTPPTRQTGADGRLYKNSDYTRLLVGFIYGDSSTTVIDFTGLRGIQNVFNEIVKPLQASLSGAGNFNTMSTSYGSANSNTTYGQGRVGWVDGLGNTAVSLVLNCFTSNSTAGNSGWGGIGVNSTSSPYIVAFYTSPAAGVAGITSTSIALAPILGFNYGQFLVKTNGATQTYYPGGAIGSAAQTFISGLVSC